MEDTQAALFIVLKRSQLLLVYLVTLHCIMAFIIISVLSVKLVLLCLVLLSAHLIWCLKWYGWLTTVPSIQRIDLSLNGDVAIYSQRQQKVYYKLVQSYACNWFVILTLASSQTRLKKRVFICHDTVNKQVFRKLNVYLKEPKLYPQ